MLSACGDGLDLPAPEHDTQPSGKNLVPTCQSRQFLNLCRMVHFTFWSIVPVEDLWRRPIAAGEAWCQVPPWLAQTVSGA